MLVKQRGAQCLDGGAVHHIGDDNIPAGACIANQRTGSRINGVLPLGRSIDGRQDSDKQCKKKNDTLFHRRASFQNILLFCLTVYHGA